MMIPSSIFLGYILSYCPTCQWRKLYCPFSKTTIFAFVEHHIFVTLDIIINKSMGHLKITFSNTNVKNVENTMLSSLKKIQQINIIYKNKKKSDLKQIDVKTMESSVRKLLQQVQ